MTKTKKKSFELNAKTSLLLILGTMLFLLVLFVPKIYLRNNIYYVSKDINKLYSNYISLKEENIFLKQQLEDTKFKNQIIDSIALQRIQE